MMMKATFKKIQRKRQITGYRITGYLTLQLEKIARFLSLKLQAWTNHWNNRQKKLFLMLVFGTWAVCSGYILVGAFSFSRDHNVLQLPRASIPLIKTVPVSGWQKSELKQITHYLDSLQLQAPGYYDSLCKRYSGVMDSLKFLQQHFQQQ